jgi:hypothetical protein
LAPGPMRGRRVLLMQPEILAWRSVSHLPP